MSDDEQQRPRGPLMLAATSVLKPGPTRIAKIGGNITLPRTVPIMSLVAGGVGASVVILLATMTVGAGMRSVILGGALGACAGVFFVTYSPMKGESMGKWLGLQVSSRRGRVQVDGRSARVYVGICPVPDVAAGLVHIVRGAVNVPEGSVDERGVFVADAHVGLLRRMGAIEAEAVAPVHVAAGMPAARTPQWAARRGHPGLPAGPPAAWADAAGAPAQSAPHLSAPDHAPDGQAPRQHAPGAGDGPVPTPAAQTPRAQPPMAQPPQPRPGTGHPNPPTGPGAGQPPAQRPPGPPPGRNPYPPGPAPR